MSDEVLIKTLLHKGTKMKSRLSACLLALVLLLGMATFLPAQTESPSYAVKPGDTGWELAREYYENPLMWKLIVNLNPKLAEPGRVFEKDGKIILILHDKEELFGLSNLHITMPKAVPISELLPITEEKTSVAETSGFPWRLLISLLGVLAFIAFLGRHLWKERKERQSLERNRLLRRTPSEIGPPMVSGGIPPTDGQRLENFFDQQAALRFAGLNPNYTGTEAPVRIGPLTRGMMHGEGQTRDLDGTWHDLRIDPPGRPGYQARYRYPDGTEEDMQAWQECMNIVRSGGGMRGFIFTANSANGTVVETPQPPAPAPQPVPLPAMAMRAIRTEADGEGRSTLTIGDRILTFERGVHLTVDEATGHVSVSGGPFEMTVKPTKQTSRGRARKSESA